MNHKIFKLIAFLAFFIPCCFADAASEAEYKKLSKSWQLNADGSQEFRYQMELTLFTHTAMNGTYGESFIVYNPLYQEVKINSSYTRQKDGNVVKTPANAFVEVLPKNAADAPAFNHLKEMVIVHTGLELGATIYLDYTVKSKSGYLPALDIFETIQQKSPVRDYTFTMVTPENVELNYELSVLRNKPSVNVKNGMRKTVWKLRNVPAISQSDFVALSNKDVPYLAATTFSSKKDAFDYLNKQFSSPSLPAIKSLATKLVRGINSKEGKIKAISEFVNHNIASNALSLEQTGYRVRPVDEVLKSVYGTEAEKFNLFVALLNAAGFNARPVVSYPVDAEQGLGLRAIKHFYVSLDNGEILLNFKNLSRPADVVFGLSPTYSMTDGNKNSSTVANDYKILGNYELSIDEKSISVVGNDNVGNDLLSYFQKGDIKKEEKHHLDIQNGYATYLLPESNHAFARLSYGKLNSRRDVNLLLPRMVDESYKYVVHCSAGIQLLTPQKNLSIDNKAGQMTMSLRKEGDRVMISRSLKLKKQLYSPSEYKYLRELLVAWSDSNSKTLLLKSK